MMASGAASDVRLRKRAISVASRIVRSGKQRACNQGINQGSNQGINQGNNQGSSAPAMRGGGGSERTREGQERVVGGAGER